MSHWLALMGQYLKVYGLPENMKRLAGIFYQGTLPLFYTEFTTQQ